MLERLASDFAERGLSFETEVDPALPPVRADRDRVIQVLTNLLINALRYTPAPGQVRVRVERVSSAARSRWPIPA